MSSTTGPAAVRRKITPPAEVSSRADCRAMLEDREREVLARIALHVGEEAAQVAYRRHRFVIERRVARQEAERTLAGLDAAQDAVGIADDSRDRFLLTRRRVGHGAQVVRDALELDGDAVGMGQNVLELVIARR